MLVLNTTSPCASPDAPAATPRYQVPSSRARTAFIGRLVIQNAKCKMQMARALEPVEWRRRASHTQGSVYVVFAFCILNFAFRDYCSSDAATRVRWPAVTSTDVSH